MNRRIVRSIDVNLPVRPVYNQWTQFEEFPRFMKGVESVRQVGDTTVQWTARIGGEERSWISTILEQAPDGYISWRGFGDVSNAGVIYFEQLGPNLTRVIVMIDYEPEETIEKIADALGLIEYRLADDLRAFKAYIESDGVATGAWRGEIHDGQAVR